MSKRRLIYSSYSPNTRPKDLRVNYRILFSPTKWIKNSDQEKVSKFFRELHPRSLVFTYNHARSALYSLFNSIGKENGNVIFQGFTCAAASLPAIWAGYTPKYIDIQDGELTPTEKMIIEGIDEATVAVVIQITFGSYPDYEELRGICNSKGILLILDSTHFIPTSTDQTLPPTDAVVYSLGRDKVVSGVDGGVLMIDPDHPLASKIKSDYNLLKYPRISWIFKRILFPILWQTIKLTYFTGLGKMLHLIYTKSGLLSRATSVPEKRGDRPSDIPSRLPGAMATLAISQLEDIFEIQKYRALLFEKFMNGITGIEGIEIVEPSPKVTPLRFALKVNKRDQLYEQMHMKGIILGDWYWNPVAPREIDNRVSRYMEDSCPNAEKLCEEIINLPLHVNVSPQDAERIISELKNYYE